MLQVATNGYTDIVELLVDRIEGDGSEDESRQFDDAAQSLIQEAVVVAAEHGHCAVVQQLMPLVMGFHRLTYLSSYYPTARSVLDAAAGNGHLEVVKFMVQHAHQYRYAQRFSIWASVDTLEHALTGRQLEVANFLIDGSGIFWNLKRAFVVAVEMELATVAERIADVFTRRFHGDNLFAELAHSGDLEAVKYLYNTRCKDERSVGKAFASAANGGHADVVEFLLGTGLISSEAFDKAFEHACSGFETTGVVTYLYNMKRASLKAINRAFAAANDVAVLKLLDENENISDESVTVAFERNTNSRFNGKLEILEFLASKPCVPSELVDEAFVAAATEGDAEIVNLLRGDSRVSHKAMGEAFVHAVVANKQNVLELMYEEQRIPAEALVKAFAEAAHRKRIDTVKTIVKLLSVEKNVPREFKCKAFVEAARHGQMQVLDIVCEGENGNWPLEVLKDAIGVAGGNVKIVNLLRKLVCDQVFKERITSEPVGALVG
ncbi:hypothetical protein PF005_g17369 [Phytophthora fragariae]|uniref:Ankyrin repeat protein n=1 Tax=Phytophthora fragariae TaxID=53985 RepID=A0A6A3X2C5_9STRA|nr:hypothetical protein PF003_g39928 [Phytophthora fragariae]KAE8931597.1 hypothetical protein PF009_g18346 [Phytophthora fragariae]KAE8995185.1 hypothetical protein PF011_g16431 [Phytophthora fragariae]KAE9095103.1 hypothetical protein PF010_g16843 [Phytophthora fragariae]KAE9097365.1 hypothetical protein PF007_g16645 [Phytophthora fragariae]